MRRLCNEGIDFDVAAREAQVVGDRQRIDPASVDEITDEARQLLRELAKSFGAGIGDTRQAQIEGEPPPGGNPTGPQSFNMPPAIATMLRHPELYRRQVELSLQVVGGAILPRERELAILRVAWLCRAPYAWGEHVEIGKLCGVSADEIERVIDGASAADWNDHDRAILRAVEELLSDQSVSDETWNALAETWDEMQLIELPVLVGTYYTMALQQNAMRVRLPAHNKGLHQR